MKWKEKLVGMCNTRPNMWVTGHSQLFFDDTYGSPGATMVAFYGVIGFFLIRSFQWCNEYTDQELQCIFYALFSLCFVEIYAALLFLSLPTSASFPSLFSLFGWFCLGLVPNRKGCLAKIGKLQTEELSSTNNVPFFFW